MPYRVLEPEQQPVGYRVLEPEQPELDVPAILQSSRQPPPEISSILQEQNMETAPWMAGRVPEGSFGQEVRAGIDEAIQAPLVKAFDTFPRATDTAQGIVENLTPSGMLNIPTKLLNMGRGTVGAEPTSLPFSPEKPFFPIPEPEGDSALAGFGKLAARNINALQTPEMLLAAPLFANPLGRLLFAEQMGAALPESVERSAQNLGTSLTPTPSDYVTEIGQPAIEAGLTALISKGPKAKPDIIDRTGGRNAIQPETAQPVRPLRQEPAKVTAEVPAEVSSVKVDAPRSQTQAEIATELGLKPDAAEGGMWQFSVTTAEGKTVPFAVKEGAAKADITARAKAVSEGPSPIERINSLPPSDFIKEVQGGQGGMTSKSYRLAETLKSEDLATLDAAREAANVERKQLMKGEVNAQVLQDALALGMKGQFFGEAAKWRRALDEARETGATMVGEFAALERKHGVGESMRHGEDLKAAFDREQSAQQKGTNEKAQTTQGQEVLTQPSATTPVTPTAPPPNMAAVSNPQPAALPTQPGRGGGPPVVPPAVTPGATPAPAPGRGPTTLTDIYSIFEPAPKAGTPLKQRISNVAEAVRTGVSSKFRPIQKLAEDIAASYGTAKKNVAGIFEQLKGSSGKGEADIYRFDQDVSKAVRGSEKDFSAYMFLRRGLDRLNEDLLDLQRAQAGQPVANLNRRSVAGYTIPELEAKLAQLESNLGPGKVQAFQDTAARYQDHMNQALQLQVDSGRMSPAIYNAIKNGNQFYAPFKVMKYIEETSRPEGSGKKIDTVADYTKAMEGIEDPNFKLGDMLGAARQNILLSRILAEKNRAMRNISELAAIDANGLFITKLKAGQDALKGMEAVNVLEGGKQVRYAVNKNVSEAISSMGDGSANLAMRAMAGLFRIGATTFNIPFQVSNLLADTPRSALVSQFGVRIIPDLLLYPIDVAMAKIKSRPGGVGAVNDRLLKSAAQSLRYPISLVDGIYSSIMGDVAGAKNKLMLDFLDSGVAGTTIQEYLTPGALRTPTAPGLKGKVMNVLKIPINVATAVEQINKVAGVKQAMKATGATSGKQLAEQNRAAVTELRRFSGSPDFGRIGGWVEKYGLNLAEMFVNPRIQGGVSDLGRLFGRDGAREAASVWINLGAWVGVPTAYLYALNHRDKESSEDYASRPAQEKQNYWLTPKMDEDGNPRVITGQDGQKMRDYWRVPKRESSKWTANFTEAALDFAKGRSPETFNRWVEGSIEDISPINIQGDTLQERMESAVSGLNPIFKAPIEFASGRDTYRHRDIVPDSQKKASPENQFTDRTAEIFKALSEKMPDVAPEAFRSPLMLENMTKNLTAGLITQFLPRKPVEGRSDLENQPLLQRFQALPYTDSSEFDTRMKELERESADTQLTRFRNANKLIEGNKGAQLPAIVTKMLSQYGPDQRMLERVVDVWVADQRGITSQERRVLNLPVQQRAQFIADEIAKIPPELKAEALRNFALKRILTESVAEEMARQKQ